MSEFQLKTEDVKMNTRVIKFCCYAVFVAAFAAMSSFAAEDSATHKKLKQEFKQAEDKLARAQFDTEGTQRQLDKLTRERQNWESEVIRYKAAVTQAQSQLDHFSKLSATKEIQKWTGQLVTDKARLAAAESELQRVTEQINAAVKRVQDQMKEGMESNLIVPGETLDVMVLEDESLNQTYEVRSGGYIWLKGVGRIQVAGKDLESAEKAIKEALQVNQIKNATVTIDRGGSRAGNTGAVIYLAGEFAKPGPWKIPAGVSPTAVTTILRSGGVRDTADLTRVRVLRMVGGQGMVEEVNVQAILDGVGLPSDLPLSPGDIIMVPPYANVVYVTGNVLHPGIIKMLPDDELTAYTAILRSGGFVRFANRKKVYVLRDRGNGEKQRIPVSIKAIQSGKGADVVLEPKDIVNVPEKFFSF